MGKFVITLRKNGEIMFNLKATNGQVILTSQGYKSKDSCLNGVESVKKNKGEKLHFTERTLGNPMQQKAIDDCRSSRPYTQYQNGKQDEEHHPTPFQERFNQESVDKSDQKSYQPHKTQGAGSSKQVVTVGMYGKENDIQHNPYHTNLIEAFQQAQVGCWQFR